MKTTHAPHGSKARELLIRRFLNDKDANAVLLFGAKYPPFTKSQLRAKKGKTP